MSAITYVGVIHQGRIELRERVALPEGSPVYVVIPSLMDKRTARRKANRWLIENVGNMVMADQAAFVQTAKEILWRFGAFITSSTHEPVGPISFIEVDAQTGQILSGQETVETMIANGEHLTCSTC